jgi:hypothetical protein
MHYVVRVQATNLQLSPETLRERASQIGDSGGVRVIDYGAEAGAPTLYLWVEAESETWAHEAATAALERSGLAGTGAGWKIKLVKVDD